MVCALVPCHITHQLGKSHLSIICGSLADLLSVPHHQRFACTALLSHVQLSFSCIMWTVCEVHNWLSSTWNAKALMPACCCAPQTPGPGSLGSKAAARVLDAPRMLVMCVLADRRCAIGAVAQVDRRLVANTRPTAPAHASACPARDFAAARSIGCIESWQPVPFSLFVCCDLGSHAQLWYETLNTCSNAKLHLWSPQHAISKPQKRFGTEKQAS